MSRLSTLVLTGSAEETAATRDFLAQVAGEDAAGYDVGEEGEIVERLESLVAAGVQYFIFNMPTSGADAVARVGELLATGLPG